MTEFPHNELNWEHHSDSPNENFNKPKHPLLKALDDAFWDARTEKMRQYYAWIEEDEEEDIEFSERTQAELQYQQKVKENEQLLQQVKNEEVDIDAMFEEYLGNNKSFQEYYQTNENFPVTYMNVQRNFSVGDRVCATHKWQEFNGKVVNKEIENNEVWILVQTDQKVAPEDHLLQWYGLLCPVVSAGSNIVFEDEPVGGDTLYQKHSRIRTKKEHLVCRLSFEALPF